jgi:hypothetical protein
MVMLTFLSGISIEYNRAFIIMDPILFLALLCQLIAIDGVQDLRILFVLFETTVVRLGDIRFILL